MLAVCWLQLLAFDSLAMHSSGNPLLPSIFCLGYMFKLYTYMFTLFTVLETKMLTRARPSTRLVTQCARLASTSTSTNTTLPTEDTSLFHRPSNSSNASVPIRNFDFNRGNDRGQGRSGQKRSRYEIERTAHVRTWRQLGSMAEGMAIVKVLERKYGKVREVMFSKVSPSVLIPIIFDWWGGRLFRSNSLLECCLLLCLFSRRTQRGQRPISFVYGSSSRIKAPLISFDKPTLTPNCLTKTSAIPPAQSASTDVPPQVPKKDRMHSTSN